MSPILSARDLVKRYGRVTALDHADFDLMPNEILGVIGDNGAGKSTLIKVLAGAVTPDHGEIRLDGRPCTSARRSRPARPASRPSTRTWRSPPPSRSPTIFSWAASAARRARSAPSSACSIAPACRRKHAST